MPRQYSMGGRVAPERTTARGHQEAPPKQSLRERLVALRNVPPFMTHDPVPVFNAIGAPPLSNVPPTVTV